MKPAKAATHPAGRASDGLRTNNPSSSALAGQNEASSPIGLLKMPITATTNTIPPTSSTSRSVTLTRSNVNCGSRVARPTTRCSLKRTPAYVRGKTQVAPKACPKGSSSGFTKTFACPMESITSSTLYATFVSYERQGSTGPLRREIASSGPSSLPWAGWLCYGPNQFMEPPEGTCGKRRVSWIARSTFRDFWRRGSGMYDCRPGAATCGPVQRVPGRDTRRFNACCIAGG